MPAVGVTATRTRTVRDRDIELFTELTGDRNPLHYDGELASSSRFEGRSFREASPPDF
jgi:acyl dehydratase